MFTFVFSLAESNVSYYIHNDVLLSFVEVVKGKTNKT